MITKLNLYKESILVPRNLEGRKDKLRQENIKLLSQEVIEGELDITKEMLDIPANLVKVKTINGNLMCKFLELTELPEWFKNLTINGGFSCAYNKLITLKNCPQHINDTFICYSNELTTLKGGPKYVANNYFCNHNKLTSLEGCIQKIYGTFDCCSNELITLEDGPKFVQNNYYCYYNKIRLEKPIDLECGTFENINYT